MRGPYYYGITILGFVLYATLLLIGHVPDGIAFSIFVGWILIWSMIGLLKEKWDD